MEFESVYDIAKHFKSLWDAVPYPEIYSLPPKPNRKDFPNHASYGVALDDWETAGKQIKEEFRKLRSAWSTETSRIEDEFKKELLKFLEVADHPKADKLWQLAWEQGHSDGFNEVAMHAEELAELIT